MFFRPHNAEINWAASNRPTRPRDVAAARFQSIVMRLLGINMASSNVTVSIKDTEAFVDLLTASADFFGWYNKTYQQQPSNHEDHPWCKLGDVLHRLSDDARQETKCDKCGDKLTGHEDDSATRCRWCVQCVDSPDGSVESA